ncbi:Trk system potassium transporter TrkA [bacterium]|nr:Trk system potassium transporter TrkA [bacterium]
MKIIIFGANELGCMIATEFFEDNDITIIGNEEGQTDAFSKLDIAYVVGHGSNINVLDSADIKNTDIFIACTENDEANIVACLTAKQMGRLKTVCFVSKTENVDSLSLVRGSKYKNELFIDYILWPEELLTQEIFRLITVPQAIDVENFANGKARLLEYRIGESSIFLNKKLKDISFPEETLIVGITRDNVLFIPDGETELLLNDKVIFMGSVYSLDILATKFFNDKNRVKNITIIGGGNVGLILAQNLEKIGIKIKIIEKDYKRCEELTENLKSTLVLHGDGTDVELMKNESIEDSDIVVSVTNSDEKNLLCSLLAKQLGVRRVITRVSKNANVHLFEKVGIDVAISENTAAIDVIENHLIKTDIDILATVDMGQGEVIEINFSHDIPNIKLKDLKLPCKAIIAIVQRRNKIIIPNGATQLFFGDNLIIFTLKENSDKIKEYFKRFKP